MMGDPGALELEQLEELVAKIMDDKVFLALIEYYCYEQHIPLNQVINHLEKLIILWAYKKHACQLKKTAEFLRIKPATLSRKLARYQIGL